ncbi:MAG TPA: lactate utilization protein [Stellaceae bacterium]|nr:lactate utilization protein [Stellaceae bacterium]
MSEAASARAQILAGIRAALKRGPLGEAASAPLAARLAQHPRNLIPARAASLDHAGRVDLFVGMAEEVQTTVDRVADPKDVPAAVAEYLTGQNLPAELVMAPDPALDAYPWADRPMLRIRRDRAQDADAVSVTPAFAAIAETGTLMLTSDPTRPTTLNLLPDTHIVVLRADQVVGPYEEAWTRLRTAYPNGDWPRTINFITGPSRTGDIEQRIQLGAHGPRRLHIVLVGAAAAPSAA